MTARWSLLVLIASLACADKALMPGSSHSAPRLGLRLALTGMPAIHGADDLLVAAVYLGAVDTIPLAFTRLPAQANQSVPLEVNLSACLADGTRRGSRDACSLYIAAALIPADYSLDVDNIFANSFDVVLIGPFEAAPGVLPTIPPIDLSASRSSAVRWVGDDALRAGGPEIPYAFTGPADGVVVQGSPTPLVFGLTLGPPSLIPGVTQPQYPQLAIFDGTWRRVTAQVAPIAQPFRQATALSPTDVYLAHGSGLYHYNGTSISRVTGVTGDLHGVGSVTVGATRLVIAGGSAGIVWIGYGQTWTQYTLPQPSRADGVCITGPNEAFAASSTAGSLQRFDGTSWTPVPGPTFAARTDLQCPAPGQAFVVAGATTVLRWNGAGWTPLPATLPGRLVSIAVASPNEIYAVGDSANVDRVYARFNGTTWQVVGRTRYTRATASPHRRPWADPRGGAAYYLSDLGRLERITPAGITVESYQPSARDLWVASPTNAYVVGMNAFLARWDGSRWHVDAPPPGTNVTRTLHGVWADGPANAWAVGELSTIYRWNGNAWTVVSDSVAPVAGLDNYNAVWGSGTDVWIAGDATLLRCPAGQSCTAVATGVPPAPLYGIWGSSPNDIWAVGFAGRILRWNGTVWSPVTSVSSGTLARVRGSAGNDVWAVGNQTLLRYDGTRWSSVPMLGSLANVASPVPSPNQPSLFQLGLWVRSPGDAYVGGDFGDLARLGTNGWTGTPFVPFSRRIVAISGTANGCALTITESLVNTPPPSLWRGIGAAGCFNAPMVPPASWP